MLLLFNVLNTATNPPLMMLAGFESWLKHTIGIFSSMAAFFSSRIISTDAAYFDVSSGVESTPGKKDLAAIKNFIVTMRNAS